MSCGLGAMPVAAADERVVALVVQRQRQSVSRSTRCVAGSAQLFEHRLCFAELLYARIHLAAVILRGAFADQGHRAVDARLRRDQFRRQAVVVADRHVRQLAQRIEPAGRREFGVEILDQETDEFLGVARATLCASASAACARAHAPESEDRRCAIDDRSQHRAHARDHARTHQCTVGRGFALALRGKLPLGRVARLALLAQVAAGQHDAASTSWVSSTRRMSSRSSMRSRRRSTSFASASGAAPAAASAFEHALLGQALAIARLGQQLVLDHPPHAVGLVGERALVEFGEDACRANRPAGRRKSRRVPAPGARC